MAGGDTGCWNIWWQPDSCSRLQEQPAFYSSPLDLTAVLGLIMGRVKGSRATARQLLPLCCHHCLLITGWLLSPCTATDRSSPLSSRVLK